MPKKPKTCKDKGAKEVQESKKKVLPLLATSHAVNHMYQLVTPTIAPLLKQDYGNADAGLFVTAFLLSYSLLPAVSGYLTQRFGRKKLLTIGFAITALSFLAIGITDNVLALTLLFFTAGAAGSMYHPSGFPILSEAYPANRGRALGLHQMGGAIGSIVGPIATGFMAAGLTWRSTVMIMAIPGLVLSAILWLSIKTQSTSNVSPSRGTSVANLRELIKYSPVILFIIAALFYALGQRGMDSYGNVYFTDGRGIELVAASILFSSLKWAGPFSAPICGKLSDVYGRRKVLLALVIVESISLYAITAVPSALLVIPCIIFGFGAFGLLTVGEALLADIAPEKQRATIFGLHLTINFSPYIFLTPILFALPTFYGYNIGFVILSILMLVSIPLILKIRNKPTRISENVAT